MAGMYDYDPGPTKQDFERAADDLKRERAEDRNHWAGYDYIPDPTPGEVWDRMQQDRNPYPC